METFTKQEVIDLLISMQVANGEEGVFAKAKGVNFGEKADSILKAFVAIKDSGKSAISFGNQLRH